MDRPSTRFARRGGTSTLFYATKFRPGSTNRHGKTTSSRFRKAVVEVILRQEDKAVLLQMLRRGFDILDMQRKPCPAAVIGHQRVGVVNADLRLQESLANVHQRLRSVRQGN